MVFLSDLDPIKIPGHNSSIRHVLFFDDNKVIISASDDRTIRMWDRNSNQEIKKLDFPAIPNDIELSRDGDLLSVCSGSTVSFWDTYQMEKIKEYFLPTKIHSVTTHPTKNVFVCGGEDFKMYKYSFEDGIEIGWYC